MHVYVRRLWLNIPTFVLFFCAGCVVFAETSANTLGAVLAVCLGLLGVLAAEAVPHLEVRAALVRATLAAGVAGVLLAIVGMFAASTLLGAIQRAKQKKSMADMAMVAACVSRHQATHKGLPASLQAECMELRRDGVHCYPDAWRACILAEVRGDSVALISRGKGSTLDPTDPFVPRGATIHFEDDLVLLDGRWITYPEGVEREAPPPNNALQRTRFARR